MVVSFVVFICSSWWCLHNWDYAGSTATPASLSFTTSQVQFGTLCHLVVVHQHCSSSVTFFSSAFTLSTANRCLNESSSVSGGQSISPTSASVPSMNSQGWFSAAQVESLISLRSGLSRRSSSTPQFSISCSVPMLLHSSLSASLWLWRRKQPTWLYGRLWQASVSALSRYLEFMLTCPEPASFEHHGFARSVHIDFWDKIKSQCSSLFLDALP